MTTLETYLEDLRARQDRSRPAGLATEPLYPIGEATIPAHVSHWAQEAPDRIALVCGGQELTYAQLDDVHRRVAGWMAEQGVGKGDRVAVHLGNSIPFVVCFLAALRLGAIHVPVNPMFGPAEMKHELADAEPALVVTAEQLSKLVHDAVADWDDKPVVLLADKDFTGTLAHDRFDSDDGDLDSVAALNYTGGTTGMPKGCEHSQRHMLYTVASCAAATELKADGSASAVCFLPIFWIAGEDLGILVPLVLGGTSVLLPRWNADEALDAIEKYGAAVMTGTVECYLELMARDDIGRRDLSSLTDPQAVSFVRKMTPQVRADWAAAAPSAGVLRESAYGMTETHTIDVSPYGLHENDMDLKAEPVFCGLPVPGTDVAVVEFGTQTPVPIGEVGEIIVRSPSVTTGYWRNPEATASQLVDGWIHTGDNGRIDEQGFLHYLGRDKEMIKVNGMSVFPAEIEMVLAQHEKVVSAAVVPVPDEQKGQRPVAFVTTHGGVQADELAQWCADRLAGYKVPQVRLVEAMPMTATGKVRKNELEQLAQE